VPSVSVADVPAKNLASVMRPSPSVTVSELPPIGRGYGAISRPKPAVSVTDGGIGSSGPGPKYTHVCKKLYPQVHVNVSPRMITRTDRCPPPPAVVSDWPGRSTGCGASMSPCPSLSVVDGPMKNTSADKRPDPSASVVDVPPVHA